MIFYFCITWLPTYEAASWLRCGLPGVFAGLPLLVSVPGDLLGGLVTDRLVARYGLRLGRCGLGAVAYVLAGVALLGAALVNNTGARGVAHRAATGLTMFTLGAAWGTVIELAGTMWRGRRDDELGRESCRDVEPAHRRLLRAVVR